MESHIFTGISYKGGFRFMGGCTKALVQMAQEKHASFGGGGIDLGKALTANAVMCFFLKGEKGSVAIKFKAMGGEEIQTIADANGKVRGYVQEPSLTGKPVDGSGVRHSGEELPFLQVTFDHGFGVPYKGLIPVETNSIEQELTRYFTNSQQVFTMFSLGVSLDTNQTVTDAGGFLIQALPNMPEEIQRNFTKQPFYSAMNDGFREGISSEEIIQKWCALYDVKILEKKKILFACSCSRKKLFQLFLTFTSDQRNELYDEKEELEVDCPYCRTKYVFHRKNFET